MRTSGWAALYYLMVFQYIKAHFGILSDKPCLYCIIIRHFLVTVDRLQYLPCFPASPAATWTWSSTCCAPRPPRPAAAESVSTSSSAPWSPPRVWWDTRSRYCCPPPKGFHRRLREGVPQHHSAELCAMSYVRICISISNQGQSRKYETGCGL